MKVLEINGVLALCFAFLLVILYAVYPFALRDAITLNIYVLNACIK